MEKALDEVFGKRFTFRRDVSWTLSPILDHTTDTEWKDKKLLSLKEDLNNVKSLLNVMDPIEWRHHTTNMSIAGRVIPHLQKTIQPELLTQAWCKFWEILNTYELTESQTIKYYNTFCSIHFCEAPGAFITALNHYMKLNRRSVNWHWMANTLNPYYEGNSTGSAILDDRFIFHTLDHWHFGSNNTGDIFDSKMVNDLHKTIGEMQVNLITADGSIDCQDVPAEQENVVAKLFLAEAYTAMQLLSHNGCFVIKMFTFFEAQAISLLYLLNSVFKEVHVFKPATSKPGNSEVYIVCRYYAGKAFSDRIISVIKGKLDSGSLIIKRDALPQTFFDQVVYCAKFFKCSQIETIKANLKAFEGLSHDEENELKTLKRSCAERFVMMYTLQPIDSSQKVAPSMTKDGQTMMFEYSQKSGSLSFTERQALRNSWLRRLGSIRALARDMFRSLDPCSEFKDTSSIGDLISALRPGQVTLGSHIKKVHSSLFCSAHLLSAWNELEEHAKNLGLTTFHDQFLSWSDRVLSEVEIVNETDAKQKVFVSKRMVIFGFLTSRGKVKSMPDFLKEETSSVNLNETDREFQSVLVRNCLKWLYIANPGDTVLLRLQTVHTRFTGGILFLLASLFKKVTVIQPPQADPMEAQIWWFSDFHPNKNLEIIWEHLHRMLNYLCRLEDRALLESVPINLLCSHSFYKFLVSRSTSVLLNRVWFLTKKLHV